MCIAQATKNLRCWKRQQIILQRGVEGAFLPRLKSRVSCAELMTRLEKLQSATADDLASLFTIMDDDGEYLPLLMPMNLIKDPDNLDEIIQSQSEWLQGEYWPGDFGLGCFDEPIMPEPEIYS